VWLCCICWIWEIVCMWTIFYNAIVVSYLVSLPFFCVFSFVLSVFFCNDHLIGVSKWRCRCSGTSCGWGVISLGGRARLDHVRYSLEIKEIVVVGVVMYVCDIIVVLSDITVLIYHKYWTICFLKLLKLGCYKNSCEFCHFYICSFINNHRVTF